MKVQEPKVNKRISQAVKKAWVKRKKAMQQVPTNKRDRLVEMTLKGAGTYVCVKGTRFQLATIARRLLED